MDLDSNSIPDGIQGIGPDLNGNGIADGMDPFLDFNNNGIPDSGFYDYLRRIDLGHPFGDLK
jgi:hypothetical protein